MLKDFFTKILSLNHDTPQDFVKSIWQKKSRVSVPWILYRGIILVYMIAGIIAICAKPSPGFVCKKNMIYFTHWAYVGEILAYFFSFVISVQRYCQEKKDPELPPLDKMPMLYKITWCIYTTSTPSVLGITVMFWVFVYDPDELETLFYTIVVHVANIVVIVVDFFVSAIPYRILHIFFVILFGVVYVLFTIIYQISGGTGNKGRIPIYKILDWRDPKIAASSCTVSLGSTTVMHCVLCVINMVKQFLKTIRERGFQPEYESDAL